MGMPELTCPFCNESEFDRPGLASHLRSWCEPYEAALKEFDEWMSEPWKKKSEKDPAK